METAKPDPSAYAPPPLSRADSRNAWTRRLANGAKKPRTPASIERDYPELTSQSAQLRLDTDPLSCSESHCPAPYLSPE